MPFSSFNDPADVARAHAALDRAWEKIKPQLPEGTNLAVERQRLAYIVASLALVAGDDHDLIQRAIARFRQAK
jgi:hypothetical protein